MRGTFLLASAWVGIALEFNLLAGSLPVITVQPQSQTVIPGNSATISVTTTGATAYQWRHDGRDLVAATSSALSFQNVDPTNSGYYVVLVKNAYGWVPSDLAYLSVVASPGGAVPLSNLGVASAQVLYDYTCALGGMPITNGSARVVAGPTLDQMRPVGTSTTISNGYFNSAFAKYVPSVAPGQLVYYRVDVSYACGGGITHTQQSTVLALTAGGGTYAVPSAAGLKFPIWPEWPEPFVQPFSADQVRIPGESCTLSNYVMGYNDFGIPYYYWRKDGFVIQGPFSLEYHQYDSDAMATLGLASIQAGDAGVYDVEVFGNNWLLSPGIKVGVQWLNGMGQLLSPRIANTNFLCDLEGVVGRNYAVQYSTDLSTWVTVGAVSNATGTVICTNAIAPGAGRFYRAQLLP